ncbi:EamA family transporter [Desulfocurvus sp. DL9XJH121]
MGPRDLALALLVAVLWGFTFVAIAVGLGSFPPLFFSALRFVGVVFPAIFFVRRGNAPWRLILGVGFVFGVVYFALLFIGMTMGMPAGLSSLVVQSQALFTTILASVVLKDRPVRAQVWGMAVAFAGLALIGWNQAGSASLAGMVLVLGSAFTWAVTNIMIKRAGNVDMFRLMLWMGLVPIVPLLGLSWVFESGQVQALESMGLKEVGAIVYLGLVATVFCFGVWGRLLSRTSPNVVAPFSLLVPVFGMSLCWLILGETMSLLEIGASLLIMLGLGMNVLGRVRADRRAAAVCRT